MKRVVVIPGDGIGPEVIKPSVDIVSSLAGDVDFHWAEAGKGLFERTGEAIPMDLVKSAKQADAVFFGATTSVRHKDYISPILTLRKELGLFANVRPVKSLVPGGRRVDMVVVRENTEGLYTGIEERDLTGVTTFRRVSSRGCERIVRFAFNWCRQHGRKRLLCVHKANVLRQSDGLFLDTFNAEAGKNPRMESSDALIDSTAMRMVMMPEEFDAIVTLNLYGDILSDLAAGLVGGLGFVPSANIGTKRALFEPAHGSAPDIAGKGIANPVAAMLSGAMMLEHLGFKQEALDLSSAIEKTVAGRKDVIDAQGRCDTAKMTKAVKDALLASEKPKKKI